MHANQKFDGRLWNTEEVFQALSQFFGIMTLQEQFGSTPMRFPRTWRIRTLIAAYRHEFSAQSIGKGYGPDWKYRIKSDVSERERLGRLPYYALKIASSQIRQAEMMAWALARVQKIGEKT